MVVALGNGINDRIFEDLLERTIKKLIEDAQSSEERKEYYLGRSAQKLEDDVTEIMNDCSKGTPFEGKIRKYSGQRFPDIVASDFYGVEVKTTKSDSWRSTGNSVLETTRIENVEQIYLLFGKLVEPLDFRFRKYEECLVDVAVTHAPRYLIDMNINERETIFSKVDLTYDEIRSHDNPAKPLLTHYREKLGDEASYWWLDIGEETSDGEMVSPLKITHWRHVPTDLKYDLKTKAFTYFPEILDSGTLKFTRLAVWLMKNHSIVNPSLRDVFTAGGTKYLKLNGRKVKVPKMIETFSLHVENIRKLINHLDPFELEKYWGLNVDDNNKFEVWLRLASDSGDPVAKKYDNSLSIEEIVKSN